MVVHLNDEPPRSAVENPRQRSATFDDDGVGGFVCFDAVALADSLFEEGVEGALAVAARVSLTRHQATVPHPP